MRVRKMDASIYRCMLPLGILEHYGSGVVLPQTGEDTGEVKIRDRVCQMLRTITRQFRAAKSR